MKLDLISRIKECPPEFHDDVLRRFNDIYKDTIFLDKVDVIPHGSVELNHIIGHVTAYGSLIWGDMITGGLKRISCALDELRTNPTYYLDDRPKKYWSFIEIDGKYLISEGKHRTTVARYFSHYNKDIFHNGPVIHGVHITKKYIDHVTMNLLSRLEVLINENKFDHLEISHYKGRNSPNDLTLFLRNPKINYRSCLSFEKDKISDLVTLLESTSSFKQFLGASDHGYLRRNWWCGFF